MFLFFRAVAIICCLAFVVSPVFSAEGDSNTVTVSDSLKDTEILLAKILKDRLNVNGTLTINRDNAEDLVLRIRFNGDPEKTSPKSMLSSTPGSSAATRTARQSPRSSALRLSPI